MCATCYCEAPAAFVIVFACWIIFAVALVLRKKPAQASDKIKAPRSWFGFALQALSYALVWSIYREWFSPIVPNFAVNIVLQILAAALAISGVILAIKAIRELGQQWSLEARLIEGHHLITTGPYRLVRHPIYTAMFAKLIATGIVLSTWWALLAALIVFLVGTLIRMRFEEKLLADAFGATFDSWRAKVPALVPFVRL